MATVRSRPLSLRVLLVLALCLTASAAEHETTSRYISYDAGLPLIAGGNGAGAPRGNGHGVIAAETGRCKNCHALPPTKAAAKTAAIESKGTTDINPAAAAVMMTGTKTAAAGSEGVYMSPAALSEEKERYISYWALLQNQPKGIPHKRGKCPRRPCA